MKIKVKFKLHSRGSHDKLCSGGSHHKLRSGGGHDKLRSGGDMTSCVLVGTTTSCVLVSSMTNCVLVFLVVGKPGSGTAQRGDLRSGSKIAGGDGWYSVDRGVL